MAKKILIALRREDQVERMVTHLEEIARPGTTVVFLVPHPSNPWAWLQDHWIDTESTRIALSEGRKVMAQDSLPAQKSSAWRRISPAVEALRKMGVQVEVDLCTRSLRKAVQDYAAKEDVDWVMVSSETHSPVARLLNRVGLLFGSVARRRPFSTLVFHANNRF